MNNGSYIKELTSPKPPSTRKKMSSLSMASRGDKTPPPPPLPNDVIVEILSWLSVSCLMRFRWACKYWFDLISRDHALSKLHSLHQHQEEINDHHEFINNNNNNTFLLILGLQNRAYNMKCSDVFCQSPSPKTVLKMDFYGLRGQVTTNDGTTVFLGSCNGLIYFRHMDAINAYFLWNPSTRELKELPQLPNNNNISCCTRTTRNPKFVFHGLGYDHTIFDYKVIRNIYYRGFGMMNGVYTLRSNSWHTKNETVPLFEEDGTMHGSAPGMFANGALHQMIFREGKASIIITFDITKEEHGEIHCPEVFSWSACSELRALNGSLWVLVKNSWMHMDAWIMKDYGVKESWTKIFTINFETLVSIGISARLHPVKYFKDSGILMLYDNTCLVAYDTKKCKIRYLQKIEDKGAWPPFPFQRMYAVVTYVETLVSLNSGRILAPDGSRTATSTVVQIQEWRRRREGKSFRG